MQALIDSNYRVIQASGHLARFSATGARGTINALGALTGIEAVQQGVDALVTGKDTEQSFAVACLFHEVFQAMQGKSLPDAIKNASLEEIIPLIAMEFLAAKKAPQKKNKEEPKKEEQVKTSETPAQIKGRETLLHENFPGTPIKLNDGTIIEAGRFGNNENIFLVTKPGQAAKTVKVGELIKELNQGQRRELYTNTLVKKYRELNNHRNELVAKRNKLSDKQDKDQNNYELHTQIKELNAEIAKIEVTMKDLYKRANDSRLIDEALNGSKKGKEKAPESPFMSARERMQEVKRGETVVVTMGE